MSILAIDVGTSSLRVSVRRTDGSVLTESSVPTPPDSPADGLAEFDAAQLGATLVSMASDACTKASTGGDPVEAVGITNQRGTAIGWNRQTGVPVGPGLGWQDLRTIGECLTIQAQGLHFAPNQSATKYVWLTQQAAAAAPPTTGGDLAFGTVDTWVMWTLSAGTIFATEPSNAAITGLFDPESRSWDSAICDALGISVDSLPKVKDSIDQFGPASSLPGSPPIVAVLGDQQASMLGQGCVRPGDAKLTLGTGGMFDLVNAAGTATPELGSHGCFPIACRSIGGEITWGTEAIMLSAGTNVAWLVDDLGLIESPAETEALAASVPDTGAVVYVPAQMGLGTPLWDLGARGTLLGMTRGTTAAHVVRAVLEGIALRSADLVEAARQESGLGLRRIRLDGGMSTNQLFVQMLADATRLPIDVSAEVEATTAGIIAAAKLGLGSTTLEQIADSYRPGRSVEPGEPLAAAARWAEAVERAEAWYPDLSGIRF